MMRIGFLFLLVTLSLHDVKVHAGYDDDDDCVRLTSAFNYDDKIYLVSGNEYFLINSEFEETDRGTLRDEFYAPRGEIDAALAFYGDLYFFRGFHYYSYTNLTYFGFLRAGQDNSDWGDFFEFGLDAASTLGNDSYFFSGCEYAKGNGDYEIKYVEDLGLPCYVDAAWNQDSKMYITFENDVWIMDENEQVSGPEKLSELVTLTSTSICPSDPFAAKIRNEQRYEREQNCTIIDAAITWDGTVYLFNDYDYITLDDEGNEVDISGVFEWAGLPGNIDAGIVWVGDDDTYFFQGDHYYEYYYYATSFARSNALWDSSFLQGIDAAGNHNSTSYFFKGCEMVLYRDVGDLDIFNNPDFNLPCDVDAAFSRENTLYVIKRNQVWIWRADEEEAEGPVSFSTAVSMTSWTACPPEE